MYKYSAKLLRVVDGDTADAMIDLGFDVWIKQRLRFKGVDTWEKRTRNKQEKVKGLAATAYTKEPYFAYGQDLVSRYNSIFKIHFYVQISNLYIKILLILQFQP